MSPMESPVVFKLSALLESTVKLLAAIVAVGASFTCVIWMVSTAEAVVVVIPNPSFSVTVTEKVLLDGGLSLPAST
jgi:hypothetical protein